MMSSKKPGAYAFAHKKAEECLDTYARLAHKQIEMEKIVVLLNKIKNSGSRGPSRPPPQITRTWRIYTKNLLENFMHFSYFSKSGLKLCMIRVLTASIIDKWRRS